MNTEYGKIADIDVHKKWLFVVAGKEQLRISDPCARPTCRSARGRIFERVTTIPESVVP